MALGKTARFYRKNKTAYDKKKAYDTNFHSTPGRKKYRAGLNRERNRRQLKGDPRDLSHTRKGKLVLEGRSKNRARNGSGGKSSLK